VYIRALPPVKNKLPKRYLPPEEEKSMQTVSLPLYEKVAHPDLSDLLTRGRYLVKLGDCAACHTGDYKRNPGRFGGGNDLYGYFYKNPTKKKVFSSNITPHETGIGTWSESAFITVIRTGKAGSLDPVMPWVAFRNMTDEDLLAIFTALKQLPPVQHRVINGIEPTYCEVCKQDHGYGSYNKLIALKADPVDNSSYADYVGIYLNKAGFPMEVNVQENTLSISDEGGPYLELVALAQNRFYASGLSTPVSFKRDASGKVQWLISYGIEEELYERKNSP
jgi:mono/diheme cytochrome c family protein